MWIRLFRQLISSVQRICLQFLTMFVGIFLFIVTLLVCSVHTDVPFITKCLSTDTSCLRSAAQSAIPVIARGIPGLNFEPLDPLHIDHVESKSEEFSFTSTDATITGASNCVLENIERDVPNSKIIVGIVCDLEYRGKYEVKGNILVVPFDGNGDITVKLTKIYLNIESNMGVKSDKQGHTHWVVKSYKYNYDLKGDANIDLTNLFAGNELLRRTAHDLLASSSNEIFTEVGPPIIKSIVDKIIKIVNKFYYSVDAEDLAIDSFQ